MSELGRKTDQGKLRWSLLPLHTIAQVIKVLEFGAAKYSVGNWEKVPDARTRYYDATMRHIEAWWLGEKVDPESGLPHLAHAVCCLLFLMWLDEQPKKEQEYPAPTDHQLAGWRQDEERADAIAEVMKRRGI